MTDYPPAQPLAKRTTRTVQDQIKQLILDRHLRSGEPLPTEAELIDALGVSRNSIREALKALQALDIVEIRHGYGTYVGRGSLDPLTDGLTFRALQALRDDLQGIRELLDVRETLEAGLIRRSVTMMADADIEALDRVVGNMERHAREGSHFPDQDKRFHELLYLPLGNTLVVQLLHAFWDVFHRVSPKLPGSESDPTSVAHWHRSIVQALWERDANRTEDALREHFREINLRVSRAASANGADEHVDGS